MKQLLRCVALLGLLASVGWAQSSLGTIVGAVKDASGASVPGSQVTVTNTATGVAQRTVTDRTGHYVFPGLIPGQYTVEASAKGFSPQQANHITVTVQSRQSVNFTLKVGAVTQEVQVISTQPLLQTQTANQGAVINSRQIETLPLNGRRYSDLALLVAGVSQTPQGNQLGGSLSTAEVANPAPDRFNVNGNSSLDNDFILDGTDNNSQSENLQENSVQAVHPPPDALSEFRIQTRTYNAKVGTSAGAVINAAIKSGGNHFHGDLWEFNSHSGLDANTYANNADGVGRSPFSMNQFGGTLGGPILRNNTFFFVDFQGLRTNQDSTIISSVPTALMRAGNFREITGEPGGANYQPLATTVPSQAGCVVADSNGSGAMDTIAPGCISSVGQKLFNLYPLPNLQSDNASGLYQGNNYQYTTNAPNHTYSTDVRVDHSINPANQVFVRYSYEHQNYVDGPWTSNPLVGNGNFATDFAIHDQSTSIGWTSTLSPTLVNEFHFGFSREHDYSNPYDVTLGQSDASQYGLNGIPVGPNSSGLPPIAINGLTSMGTSQWRPQFQVGQVWQYTDNLSQIHGNHNFQYGYEYHRASDTFLDIQAPEGYMNASGIYSTGAGNYGMPDFLLGDMSSAVFDTPQVAYNYYPGQAWYAQDTWQMTTKLTVTYGLRYELFSPLLSRTNQLSNFYPTNGGEVIPVAPDASGMFARSTIHPDLHDFAPRLGFAYHMMPAVVWRGGAGIYYDHRARQGSESMLDLNPPFLVNGSLSQPLGSTTPVFTLGGGFPINDFTNPPLSSLQIRAQDPYEDSPDVTQVSFGPEIQLNHNTVLDFTGVGTWARHMNRLRDANQGVITGYTTSGEPIVTFPYPNLNTVLSGPEAGAVGNHAFLELATDDGNTDYAAFETTLRRQYQNGFMYSLNYTYSHGMSNDVDNLTGGAEPEDSYNYGLEMGNSPFDVTHRVVGDVIYDLPVGNGRAFLRNAGGAGQAVLGGWQLNAIVSLQSGIPFSVGGGNDLTFTDGEGGNRPDCAGDFFTGTTTDPSQLWIGGSGTFLNPAAFSQPGLGQFGTCAPRMFHGPGIENTDLSLFKNFRLGETRRLQVRGEFFNFFNHANFGSPNGNIASGSFGQISSLTTPPRIIQLAAKFYF
ncbi:MAG: carboxypeptidase regulatory-like domain-containing protein [Terriglobales bacterium]